MLSETTKPTHLPNEGDQKHKHKQFGRDLRDMVHAITDPITDLQKPGSSHHLEDEDDDHGVRIITLAGTNTGATMRSELDDKNSSLSGVSLGDHHHQQQQQPEPLATYVNSNFQAVNNSIMLGSSYNTNDPGVHLDIADFYENHHGHHKPADQKQHAKKGKKKDKESLKSDHHSDHSN
ncbi:hypothetical protein Ddye_003026 [Dipteronia dyeriana]|uniref:Uncharacterized protein n=1 Tax=Dipteronia dyeriana TaxID=168575 RepID=A0AAE0CUX3_9ROSI|nr:hypothetical protein Ddye_003026 [Dipteronia dyeriana]